MHALERTQGTVAALAATKELTRSAGRMRMFLSGTASTARAFVVNKVMVIPHKLSFNLQTLTIRQPDYLVNYAQIAVELLSFSTSNSNALHLV